jgi:hypothetical protein
MEHTLCCSSFIGFFFRDFWLPTVGFPLVLSMSSLLLLPYRCNTQTVHSYRVPALRCRYLRSLLIAAIHIILIRVRKHTILTRTSSIEYLCFLNQSMQTSLVKSALTDSRGTRAVQLRWCLSNRKVIDGSGLLSTSSLCCCKLKWSWLAWRVGARTYGKACAAGRQAMFGHVH